MSEQEDRQVRSERILAAEEIALNPTLPMIESEAETQLRTPQQVASRMLILLCMVGVSQGLSREEVERWLRAEGVWEAASERERRFLLDDAPSERDTIQASWSVECAWLLGWALGLIDPLGLPVEQCESGRLYDLIPGPGEETGEFIATAKLRPKVQLVDASDLLYRAHWAIRQATLDEDTAVGRLDSGVAMEWHKAINWLTCYGDEDNWDRVTTDT